MTPPNKGYACLRFQSPSASRDLLSAEEEAKATWVCARLLHGFKIRILARETLLHPPNIFVYDEFGGFVLVRGQVVFHALSATLICWRRKSFVLQGYQNHDLEEPTLPPTTFKSLFKLSNSHIERITGRLVNDASIDDGWETSTFYCSCSFPMTPDLDVGEDHGPSQGWKA
uniref:Uncharacterized protein n=1 Tax=Compsopogon caeruleus TaxID=31354 RepID=A0A7S1TEL9_9RHOD|mmetsp:Transcript_16920/g.35129  ORF Transcript_16920/g.35129 Transcript_16920/m.35129 type:complete len:171 (+) Transcript_16920:99-611(+)